MNEFELFAAIADPATQAGQMITSQLVTWNTIILAAIQMVTVLVTSISAYYIAKLGKNSDKIATAAIAAQGSAEATGRKTDMMSDKIVEIHTATDGNLTRLSTALTVSGEKLEGMQKLLAQALDANKSQEVTLARVRQDKDVSSGVIHQIQVPPVLAGPIIATGPVVRSIPAEADDRSLNVGALELHNLTLGQIIKMLQNSTSAAFQTPLQEATKPAPPAPAE